MAMHLLSRARGALKLSSQLRNATTRCGANKIGEAKLILPDGTEASLPLMSGTTGTDKFMDIQTLYKQVRASHP
jgi:hypothetical protein